ncbi:MAG: type II secretion system minor pseudopilin GspJ [Gammaproteobacteria bacterium]|nr:type II secretion system minor pseudopilin GspJ [Gammaproteobacteria bacterium]MCF6229640.1 type II secretion system minor pseudopilin GspJ [Gammaproteobacteria bacterium]
MLPVDHKQRGFTLLELIIAISIFGVIMVMAYGALRHIADTAHHLEQRSEQLADLQRAFFIISKDFQLLADRKIRDQFGDEQPALIVDEEGRVEFTRSGWRNPLGQLRSSLQRVAYHLEEGVLYRDYWRVLDRAQDSEPLRSDLIKNVEKFAVELLPPQGEEWKSIWPPYNNNPDQVTASLPKMVKVTLSLEGVGDVWRFYSVVQDE